MMGDVVRGVDNGCYPLLGQVTFYDLKAAHTLRCLLSRTLQSNSSSMGG